MSAIDRMINFLFIITPRIIYVFSANNLIFIKARVKSRYAFAI